MTQSLVQYWFIIENTIAYIQVGLSPKRNTIYTCYTIRLNIDRINICWDVKLNYRKDVEFNFVHKLIHRKYIDRK